MALTTTRFFQYSVLPGIWPRIKVLLGTGLSFMPGMLAVVYFNLGLLPKGHPYLAHSNYGRFSIRHVVAAAGKNLTFSWKHADQVVLYFTVLIGLVILMLQLVLAVSSVFFYASVFASTTFLGNFDSSLTPSGSIRAVISAFFDGAGVGTTGWVVFTETVAGPSQDIAFVVLDHVFGITRDFGSGQEGFFRSCVSTSVACENINGEVIQSMSIFPSKFHIAMHQMFSFYTMGIGYLSSVVLLYYVVTVVGETITTGTPFGQRFNKAWVIPRMIVFFALLAPIGANGINAAQLITFSVAKYGSNFATNAWIVFLEGGVDEASGQYDVFFGISQPDMLVIPKIPELGALAQYMYVVRMCMYAENLVHNRKVIPYIVRPHSDDTRAVKRVNGGGTVPYNKMGGTEDDYMVYTASVPFADAVEFSRYNDVVVRFGHRNPPGFNVANLDDNPFGSYSEEWGYVKPVCGELQFEVTSLDPFVIGPTPTTTKNSSGYGTESIQEVYWTYIDDFLFWDITFEQTAYCMLNSIIPYANNHLCIDKPVGSGWGKPGEVKYEADGVELTTQFGLDSTGPTTTPSKNNTRWLTLPLAKASIEAMNEMNRVHFIAQGASWYHIDKPFAGATSSIYQQMKFANNDPEYVSSLFLQDEVKERGWVGAALWYNQLARLNGLFTAAIQNVPRPFKYPMIMEEIARQHQELDKNSLYTERFNPRLSNGRLAKLSDPKDQYIAAALYSVYAFWSSAGVQETVFTRKSNNTIIDIVNTILGTHGISDIVQNRGVYPLSMLSGLGKSMVDAALRNLWGGIVGQGLGEIMDSFLGGMGGASGLMKVGSTFAFRFGMIGLGIGFILYYVLPVLPFVYFFFGFGGWIKSIFEAIVAMPLWALAHLNIEGNGLPGPWATNGYFLLFEILLRPILLIGGFIFSISAFAALINSMHDMYHIVVMVVSGYNIEGEINDVNSGAITKFTSANPLAFMRGPIDEIFYSVIYVIIVYMVGLSCFKLVDTIPDKIMRWMGATVSAFSEHRGDPAGEMTGRMFRATQVTNIQLVSMIQRAQGFGTNSHQDTLNQLMLAQSGMK